MKTMRNIFLAISVLISICQPTLYSQVQTTPEFYAHKVVVDSILQTKDYTYLKVNERIKEKDSVQWLALPTIEAKAGDIFYFDSGMQMGEFHSETLNRTFNQILFLGGLSTSAEVSDKNIVPAPVMDTLSLNTAPVVVHTVVVKEVIQTSGYSYLRVKEGDKEKWLAIVRKPAIVGQTYTYDDAAPVKDFTSKELKRTFKEVFFIAKLTLVTDADKKEPSLTPSYKSISIAKLLKNKKSYSGKTVKIKGKVTKYSSAILNRNWIHIEDGTNFSGKYDLTITTDQEVKVGDTITVEGKISLDKDFGSGYFFDVIMEDAKLQNK